MNVLLAESVLVPVLMAGPPLAACCWLLWRVVGTPHDTKPATMPPCPLEAAAASDKRSRWAVATCAAAMYIAALLLPTAAPFNSAFSSSTFAGYETFRVWKVLVEWESGDLHWWLLSLAWLANPAIWATIALTAAGCRRVTRMVAGCGLVLGLVPLPWYFLMVAGLPGYWAWVGSAGLMLAASLAPWHWVASGSAVAGDFADDYDDAVSPPNPLAAPNRSGVELLNG